MFGSAFTRQIGTHHINEEYPSYWANKFIERGFYPADLFRKNVWFDDNIEPCYRQNTFLYVKENNKELAEIFKKDFTKNFIPNNKIKFNKSKLGGLKVTISLPY